MKRLFLTLAVAGAFTLSPPSCTQLQTAYNAITKATTYSTDTATADQILIRSEQLTRQALITFDTFLFIERNNETILKNLNPNIHVVAEKIRAHGQEWLKAARRTTKTFKANRTEANAANMRTAYATLKQAYDEVKAAQKQADTLSSKTP